MRETPTPRTHFRQNGAGRSSLLLRGRRCVALIAPILTVFFLAAAAAGQTLTLQSNAAGILINSSGPNAYTASFGTMNGLGVGTPSTGVTAIPLSNGTLYYTLLDMQAGGLARRRGNITATLRSIGHPSAFTAETCPAPAGCTSSTSYTALSTMSTNTIATGLANKQTVTSGLAILVPDNNGPSYFAGTDTIVITYTITRGRRTSNVTLTLTVQSQTAVSLTLGSNPGGATIATALDYSLDFGNVNALGIGPGAGFTTSAVAGGVIYSTSYSINPAFAEFSSTTATISAYVSMDFAHPTILDLRDASASSGPYSSISNLVGTPTQITATAADRTPMTRYLGLYVSDANGAGAFTGMDNATLTYTLTVP
jgi:hypothetical protein